MLKKFYETLQANGEQSLKIIFISSDHSEKDMWQYMYESHGDWLALKYDCKELKDRLSRQFQVSGIPQLVVINGVGSQAVRDARGEVMAAANASSTQVLTSYLGWKTAAGAAASPQVDVSGQIAPGTRIRIRGLQGRPENNGLEGAVESFDASKQRYLVQLGDRQLSLKASNLLQLLNIQVRLDKESGDEAVWLQAQVADFDDVTGECLCQLDGEEVRLHPNQPSQLRLGAGALVTVQGLKGQQQWNEQNGKVTDFDETTQRYTVQVAAGTALKIKPDNIRLFPLS